jgi:hypothetical protein
MALGVASGQYNLPWAIMTNLGHITGPLWKHPFILFVCLFAEPEYPEKTTNLPQVTDKL